MLVLGVFGSLPSVILKRVHEGYGFIAMTSNDGQTTAFANDGECSLSKQTTAFAKSELV